MSARDNAGSYLDSGMHWETSNGFPLDSSHARQKLQEYLSQMAVLHPEREHPNMEFVDALLEDQAVVRDHDTALQDLAADRWPAVTAADTHMDEVKTSIRSLAESMESRFNQINEKLSVQDKRNFYQELSSRQIVESQRQKDRKFRANSFVQPMAKFHALDLFDLQEDLKELAGHASLVAPPLASNFGSSTADGTGVIYDPDATVTYRDLAPMYDMIGRLLWSVDRKVHVQQMAGTSKAGYVPTYNFIQRKEDGNAVFSGSKTDREYWGVELADVQKEMLREQAHQKQISALSGPNSKGNSNSRGQNSNPGASGNFTQKTNKQKHNAKQRKLYNKRKKAKEAKAKAAETATSGNSGGPKQ